MQTWPRSQNSVVASVFTWPQSNRIGRPFTRQFTPGERPALCFVTAFTTIFYSIIRIKQIESAFATQYTDKSMTKRNNLLSVLLSLILLSAIILLVLNAMRQQELNTTSQELAIELTQRILSRDPETQVPNVQALLDNAHPSLLQRRSTASSTAYIAMVFKNLGELEVIENISGASETPLLVFSDVLPRAAYVLEAVFANGSSTVEIQLIFDQDRWSVIDFSVKSSLMVL